MRRRARTDAPTSRNGLRIDCERFEIGPDDFPDAGLLGIAGDLGGRCLALTQRLLHALEGLAQTYFGAIPAVLPVRMEKESATVLAGS